MSNYTLPGLLQDLLHTYNIEVTSEEISPCCYSLNDQGSWYICWEQGGSLFVVDPLGYEHFAETHTDYTWILGYCKAKLEG